MNDFQKYGKMKNLKKTYNLDFWRLQFFFKKDFKT